MPVKTPDYSIVLGIMSGTSLDGLDLALCSFKEEKGSYSFQILSATTIAYSDDWRKKLSDLKNLSAEDYFFLHAEYGKFIAEKVNNFLIGSKVQPAAIASHGHTIFHQPQKGFSTQLGCGATVAAITGITTINDFRSLDVAMNGQGAPLVPMGDKYLFGKYDACLNIGGIANISFDLNGDRKAYDVCVANMLLNYLSEKEGRPYDEGGNMARSGKINKKLLNDLNKDEFYSRKGAKSLGREWFEKNVLNLISASLSTKDLLATATEHVATQIAADLNRHKIKKVLVTGGGAFNTFLIERLQAQTPCKIEIPPAETINFKEALIFAFLGYLRLQHKTNTLSTVTGALRDSVGGAVYLSSK